jgi:predicted ATPase
MLSLPNDGRYPALELPPHQRRQKTMEALTAQIEALSHVNPILMIFEDVHWMDPTSLEALGRFLDRTRTLCALLVVTYRPEFQPPWSGQPHVTALTVNRLGQREISLLIEHITGNKRLPDELKQDIVERTDGVPLFVEEMTKAIVEAEGEQSSERIIAAIPSPSVAVPASLHASLMARLDRLGPAKEVAQIAAVLGRNFSHDLLAAAARKEEAELQAALDGLLGAGLLFRQGIPPHATYLFKHGLVQDAAYSTLLRERRRLLHRRIAEILETQFPETAESQPELIARHCTEAGLIEKAVAFWAKAGRRSMARSALVEAVAQLTRALDQIATLPSTPRLRREQIELQVATITPLMHVKGHSAPEVKAATERARLLMEQAEALGEPPENPLLLYSVLFGFWITNAVAFNGDAALALAGQFLELAEKQGASVPLLLGHGLMGFSLLVTGNFTQSLRQTDQALALYDPAVHRPLAMLFGQDVRVTNLSQRSLALWFLGYPDAALAGANQFLKEARQIDQVGTLFHALNFSIVVHFLCGAHPTADALANELFTLADEQDAGMWKPVGLVYRGWILAASGRASEAVQLITSALAAIRATGTTLFRPVSLSLTAKCYADLGQLEDAGRSVDEATTVIEGTKETWFEADVYRIAGEIALKSPQPDAAKAEAYFERALAVARQQQARSFELRDAMSLARLWRSQGKVQQARELLAPVYGWFTEGFDTRDLKEAKALLEELAV